MLPPINQPDEQIAQLQAQLARLQQENTELRSRLETCQLEQQSQSDENLQPLEITRDRLHDSYVKHRLLEATAKAANALLTIADFEQAINTALQILGESLETDRTKVLESLFDDPARPFSRYHNVIYEWIRPGTVQQLSHTQAGQWDSDYMQALRQQKILIQDLRQFADNPAYAAYHAHNQQRGIKMIFVVALFFGETFLGSITLRRADYRDYKPEEVELIGVLAHQAALAIQLTCLAEQGKQAAISEERNRMAREIHDTLAQSFTSIRMQLEAANRFLGRKPEQAQSCITFAQELAQSGLAEARRSVWALQPEAESYRHLSTTLERLAAQQTAETSISIEVAIVGTAYPLPPDVGMNLLRIGQEALNNAIRHACARTIILTLTYAPDQIQLQIQDDGQGFDPQLKLSIGGFGFIGMQQRSERLGGTCTISSRLGQGTEVRVTVPVQKESQRG